jgi:hypothetical protein
MLARRLQHVQDGVFVQSGQPGYGPDADTLTEHLNHHCGFVRFDSDARKRLRLGERLAASQALKALHNAVAVGKTAKLFDFITGTAPTIQLRLSGLCSKLSVNRPRFRL